MKAEFDGKMGNTTKEQNAKEMGRKKMWDKMGM